MEIRVQPTPNPNAHKYVLSEKMFALPLNASTAEAAAAHPLAASLFTLDDVYNVLLAQDFVTVNKLPAASWNEVDEAVLRVLAGYFG
jgi:hypothetical protein